RLTRRNLLPEPITTNVFASIALTRSPVSSSSQSSFRGGLMSVSMHSRFTIVNRPPFLSLTRVRPPRMRLTNQLPRRFDGVSFIHFGVMQEIGHRASRYARIAPASVASQRSPQPLLR